MRRLQKSHYTRTLEHDIIIPFMTICLKVTQYVTPSLMSTLSSYILVHLVFQRNTQTSQADVVYTCTNFQRHLAAEIRHKAAVISKRSIQWSSKNKTPLSSSLFLCLLLEVWLFTGPRRRRPVIVASHSSRVKRLGPDRVLLCASTSRNNPFIDKWPWIFHGLLDAALVNYVTGVNLNVFLVRSMWVSAGLFFLWMGSVLVQHGASRWGRRKGGEDTCTRTHTHWRKVAVKGGID